MSVEDNTTRHEATRLGVHTHQAGMAKTLSSAEWTTHIAGEYSAPRRQPHTTLGSHCCCCRHHATARHADRHIEINISDSGLTRRGEARRGGGEQVTALPSSVRHAVLVYTGLVVVVVVV